jgi:hypothetical protein
VKQPGQSRADFEPEIAAYLAKRDTIRRVDEMVARAENYDVEPLRNAHSQAQTPPDLYSGRSESMRERTQSRRARVIRNFECS